MRPQNRAPRRYVADDDVEPAPPQVTTRLLLLGDAGSGKTTTLRYAALRLADAYVKRRRKRLADAGLGLYLSRPPLPIYVRLTEFARSLPKGQNAPPTPDQFLTWLDEKVTQDLKPAGAPALSRYITDGRTLLLLDGLDEAGSERRRADLAEMIGNLAETYDKNRYVVASRPAGYGGSVHLDRFTQAKLSDLNEPEARALLVNWFSAVEKLTAKDEAQKLWGAIELNDRLLEMASRPLLLTAMAALHLSETELPNDRAKLYEKLVDLLLRLWRKQQLGAEESQEEWSVEQLSEEREHIEDMALLMQKEQATEVTLEQAQTWLCPRYMPGRHLDAARAHVYDLLEVLTLHSGLLQRRGETTYAFSHYTFQEYMAACALDDMDKHDRYRSVAFLLERSDDQRWRETLLLAAGRWSGGRDLDKAERLIGNLLEQSAPNARLLAGEALADIRAEKKLPLLRDRAAAELKVIAFSDPPCCPDPRDRNRAATLLDLLGADGDRPGLSLEDDDYWADRIEPSPFMMGEGEKSFPYAIKQPYRLARYPVTNRQYARFLEALEKSGKGEQAEHHRPRYWPGRRYRPGEGNHPVVGVSWEDACAFARWADETLRAAGKLEPGEEVRLPTEPEWERAAAYPLDIPKDDSGAGRREYPWGDWPQEASPPLPSQRERGVGGEGDLTATTTDGINSDIPANIDESGIGGTSVVGVFPHGAAGCGAQDMAGNVWEWCASAYYRYPLPEDEKTLYTLDEKAGVRTYVLRGGSWRLARSFARCAARGYGYPGYFPGYVGLRLARLFSFT